MALRGAAARRYAQAVFEIAKQDNSFDRWLSDLKVLNGIFGSSNAVSVLEDPRLTSEQRRGIVADKLPKDVVSELAMNFLMLLLDRQRLDLLPRIVELYQEMYNKHKGVVVATVTTAVPLDEPHRKRVADEIIKITGGKEVDLRLNEDPRILGGVIVRVGDQLIDASVASRLAMLGERLT